jgi:hypothetical protein
LITKRLDELEGFGRFVDSLGPVKFSEEFYVMADAGFESAVDGWDEISLRAAVFFIRYVMNQASVSITAADGSEIKGVCSPLRSVAKVPDDFGVVGRWARLYVDLQVGSGEFRVRQYERT